MTLGLCNVPGWSGPEVSLYWNVRIHVWSVERRVNKQGRDIMVEEGGVCSDIVANGDGIQQRAAGLVWGCYAFHT